MEYEELTGKGGLGVGGKTHEKSLKKQPGTKELFASELRDGIHELESITKVLAEHIRVHPSWF
jgi:hypothetical protein